MLEPQDRRLLLEALRPPEGFELDHAIGTTFSLDLIALLTAPLAFTAFDWEDDEGRPPSDPYALLAALRGHASKITLFCQSGRIAVPPAHQRLLAELENSVVQVRAPRHAEGGVFHPKVWLLRFVGVDDSTRYRLLCLSRNLTFDRCWDVALVLDGVLTSRRNGFKINNDLAAFVAALPTMSSEEIEPERLAAIGLMQDEVRRVAFEPPEGLELKRFWPLGLDHRKRWPFDTRIDRMLVISPFVAPTFLDRLANATSDVTLVSRAEELTRHGSAALSSMSQMYVLDDAAASKEVPGEDDPPVASGAALTGLHAKAYIADQGWHATAWVGSANATQAAFSRNVEFLVELSGSKAALGTAALLAPGEAAQPGFRDLLTPWLPPPEPEVDGELEALETLCDDVRRAVVAADPTLEIGEEEKGTHPCLLRLPGLELPQETVLRAWLATLGHATAVPVDSAGNPTAAFRAAAADVTPFVSFEVIAKSGGRESTTRFTMKATLLGDPHGRREAVLKAILRDRAGVIRLLLLLMSAADAAVDPSFMLALDAAPPNHAKSRADGHLILDVPLLEPMLLRAARNPNSLLPVKRMLDDLIATDEGRELVSEEVISLWDAVWAAVASPKSGRNAT